jgi:hypothetical protein
MTQAGSEVRQRSGSSANGKLRSADEPCPPNFRFGRKPSLIPSTRRERTYRERRASGSALGYSSKWQPIPALPALTFTVHVSFGREIYDFNELRPGRFASPPRSNIVGIAGDPQLRQSMTNCQGNDQSDCTGCEATPPVFRAYPVSNVASVQPHVVSGADSQMDFPNSMAGFFAVYVKHVVRDPSLGRIGRPAVDQLQAYDAVVEFTGVQEDEAAATHNQSWTPTPDWGFR